MTQPQEDLPRVGMMLLDKTPREWPLKLTAGQRVYYTGDMANDPAWLTVIARRGENSYDLREVESGRIRRGVMWIGHVYAGHCDPRYVSGEAYDAYMAARTGLAARVAALEPAKGVR